MFMNNWVLPNCELIKILGQIKLANCSHLLITNYIKKILSTLQNECKLYFRCLILGKMLFYSKMFIF